MIYKMELADSVDDMIFDLLEVPIEDKDIEGTADNTTIDGNVFTDYLWLKKQFVQKWSLMCEDDYTQLRGFYTRQWENAEVPTYKLYYGENVSSTDTATGNQISLTNSTDYDAPILDFEMQGNAEQTTYSGKNLVNLPENTSLPMAGAPTTVLDFGEDRTISAGRLTLFLTNAKYANNSAAVADFIQDDGTTHNYRTAPQFRKDGVGMPVNTVFTGAYTAEITNITFRKINIYLGNNYASWSQGTVNVQFELGSTATDYEPYVGGTASPNPDYPQAVNTTTGENVVKITGKNLFDKDSAVAGLINRENGQIWTTSSYMTSDYIKVEAGQTYTSTGFNNWYRAGFNAQKQWTSLLSESDTFTIPNGVSFIRMSVSNADLNSAQFELGSTATTYEPYQGQEFEVNLGKNLLQITENSTTINGTTFTVNSDGSITVSGTPSATANFVFSQQVFTPQFASIISANDIPVGSSLVVKRTTAGGTITYPSLLYNGSNSYNLTVGSTYEQFLLRIQSTFAGTATFKFQIERGSTATTYAPYFTPIELAKIGTYQDRIYKNDGKWYVEKQIGKVVVDATNVNNWALNNTTYSIPMMRTDKNILGIPATWDSGIVLMNRYSETSSTNNIYSGAFTTNFQKGYLITFNNAFTDEETGRNTLIGTEIYYALATPITTEITNQALIDQLDAIVSAYLPRGAVNISLTGTGAQGSMVLEYKLIISKETIIKDTTPVRLTLTDGGVINPCGCRQNIQLIMRETVQ